MQADAGGELDGFGGRLGDHDGRRRVVVRDGEAREARGPERVVRAAREGDDDIFGPFGKGVVDGGDDEGGDGGAGGKGDARAERGVIGAGSGAAGDRKRHRQRGGLLAGAGQRERAGIGPRFGGRGVGRHEGDDGGVGVGDGDGHRGRGADAVGRARRERERHGLGGFDQRISQRRERERGAARAGGKGYAGRERRVIRARGGGAAHGEGNHERGPGPAGAREGPLTRRAVFRGGGGGGGERDDRQIVVGDGDGVDRGAGERSAGGAGQRHHEGIGRLDDAVIEEGERDQLGRLARREGEGAGRKGVVGAAHGGAAGHGITDRDRRGHGLAEGDEDGRRGTFRDRTHGGGEPHGGLERRDVVVADDDDVLIERGGERGAVGVAEGEHDELVGLGQEVVDEGERDRLRRDAGSEGQHARRKGVVDAGGRSGVGNGRATVELREGGAARRDQRVAGIGAEVFPDDQAGHAVGGGAGAGNDAGGKCEVAARRHVRKKM